MIARGAYRPGRCGRDGGWGRRMRALLLPCAALAVALASLPAAAEPVRGSASRPQATYNFDISALPLVKALEAYSSATGLQVLYDSVLASGRQSAGVKGLLTPEAALRDLLRGTDLVVRYTEANDIVLVPSWTDAAVAGPQPVEGSVLTLDALRVEGGPGLGSPGDPLLMQAYTRIIQEDIRMALQKNPRTRSGSYRIGVDLWIGQRGGIQRAELFRSTGDRERDAAISQTLHRLAIRQSPPANMPQPVSVVIMVKSM